MTEVIIGSRESKLAVLQSEMVKSYIEQKNREKNAGSEITVNILTMKTTGDIILDRTLDKVGGKGLFVKELDRALLDGKSNLSVHSLKDMPMRCRKSFRFWPFQSVRIQEMYWCFLREWRSWIRINLWDVPA